MVFREHDAQTVFQRELLDGNLYFGWADRGAVVCGDATPSAVQPQPEQMPRQRIRKRFMVYSGQVCFCADTVSYFQWTFGGSKSFSVFRILALFARLLGASGVCAVSHQTLLRGKL